MLADVVRRSLAQPEPPRFVDAATGTRNGTGAGSVVVNRPGGAVEGNIMIAAIFHRSGNAIGLPAGWTTIVNHASTNRRQHVAYKVMGASEPSSYTFTGSEDIGAVIAAYSGADNAAPVDVTSFNTPGGVVNATALSVTTTVDNCKVLAIAGMSTDTAGLPSTPTGTTSRGFASATNVDASVRFTDFDQPTAGATGDKVFTGDNGLWVAHQIALRAA